MSSLRLKVAGAVAATAVALTGVGIGVSNAASTFNGCTVSSTATLSQKFNQGRYSSNVKAVQCLINAHAGQKVLVEDGYFGPATNKAVRKFQGDKGLVVDGFVGPKTWAALKAPAGSRPTTKPTVKPTTPPVSSSRAKAVVFANSKVGGPYVWGGNGPRGFDCSGLTLAAMKAGGVTNAPRTAGAQGQQAPRRVSRATLQPGDLIVSNSGGHVAMYVGDGYMVHAVNPSLGIRKEKLDGSWHQNRGVYYVSYFK
ncbi:hypothetical protein GCM10027418_23290 [Mariniluteicoccus endophyticus]